MHPLPPRSGPRPATTSSIPHTQTEQQPEDDHFLAAVLHEAGSWPGVGTGPSGISVEGARALLLDAEAGAGPADAFMVDREFAHGHAQGDHSLHLTLPPDVAETAHAAGWVEPHFLVLTGQLPRTHVMCYAPRDEDEAAITLDLLRASYHYASGR